MHLQPQGKWKDSVMCSKQKIKGKEICFLFCEKCKQKSSLQPRICFDIYSKPKAIVRIPIKDYNIVSNNYS